MQVLPRVSAERITWKEDSHGTVAVRWHLPLGQHSNGIHSQDAKQDPLDVAFGVDGSGFRSAGPHSAYSGWNPDCLPFLFLRASERGVGH